jgi:LPS export ABC transporter protein LptC
MRWLGGVALSILVIIGLLTVLGQGPGVPGLGPEPVSEGSATGYAAEHARLVQTDERGTPLYLLEAERLDQDAASGDVAARDLRLNYVPPDDSATVRPWTLTARDGKLPGGTLQIALTGNVRLTGEPEGARAPLRLETASLDFDIEKQTARTRAPVSFYWGSRRLTARGLDADLKQGTLRLESSVHGRFPP